MQTLASTSRSFARTTGARSHRLGWQVIAFLAAIVAVATISFAWATSDSPTRTIASATPVVQSANAAEQPVPFVAVGHTAHVPSAH